MTYNSDNRCLECGAHIADPHSPDCPSDAPPFHLKDFRLAAGLTPAELAYAQGKQRQQVHQSENFDDWKLSTVRNAIAAAGASAIIVVTLASGDKITYTL